MSHKYYPKSEALKRGIEPREQLGGVIAPQARQQRVSCPNIQDVSRHVSWSRVSFLRLPIRIMAECSAHVCYRKGIDVT